MMHVYYGLIRSKIDYGAEVYESANPTIKPNLDSIQAKAIRVCLGLPRATASEALRMEGSEMALSLTLYRLSGQIFSDGCSVGLARATPPDTRHENSAAQSVRRLFFVDPAYRIWRCFNGRKFVHSIVGD